MITLTYSLTPLITPQLTETEVAASLARIKPSKASGPDGLRGIGFSSQQFFFFYKMIPAFIELIFCSQDMETFQYHSCPQEAQSNRAQ